MSTNFSSYKYVVVGAGLFGAVIAERIANDLGERVLVIDKRPQIGGNCYSLVDGETGIECHQYGTHIFHTANVAVWNYLNNFTSFTNYQHQVFTVYQGRYFRLPINLETINAFYGRSLTPSEARDFIRAESAKAGLSEPKNLEEKAIALIGRPLYEALIKGYTEKQWGCPATQLPAFIIERLPVRHNYDSNYYYDRWQGLPQAGYTALFDKLLTSPKIDLLLNIDYFSVKQSIPDTSLVIYSGPIDQFFDYKFGKLGWRTLDFQKELVATGDFQGTAVVNYAESTIPYTRIHEPRHLHPERNYQKERTVIFREFSRPGSSENGYYPINTSENQKLLSLYQAEAQKLPQVIFGGRLGSYQYSDMDKVVAAALDTYQNKISKKDTPWQVPLKQRQPLLIAMVTCNRLEFTKATVFSLLENTSPLYELVIIDNASTDGTQEFLASLPNHIRVIFNHANLGPAKALNMALRLRSPEQHFMKIDNDLAFEEMRTNLWLEKLLAAAQNIPNAGQLCLRPYNHKNIAAFPTSEINGTKVQLLERDCPIGFAFPYTRQAIAKVGAFCEDYGKWGFDDSDLSNRIRLAGFKIGYFPEVRVRHLGEPQGQSAGSTLTEKEKKKIIWWKAPLFARRLRAYQKGKRSLYLPLHQEP